MVGRTVLQYQLIEKLGAGGMGEVYKALDTRLNRFVAIKVLSAGISADPESRRRFIREAQAASALNHPNIITIYDVVSDGETEYMVVEYVAGKTLQELIPKQGLRVPDAIGYARQMADALGAAHMAGIVHRDLKPANVMVNSSGLVKLLDFGLAKLMDWMPGDHTGNTATAIHNPLTVAGTIMGTANYMSPEQAEGRKLDGRSDIFSFGAVLYEMLTGRAAFHGESPLSTLSAVLRDDVQPIPELTAGVPPELERIVIRCLKKDPDQRFQSMQDVNAALRDVGSDSFYSAPTVRTVTPLPPPARSGFPGKFVALALLLVLGAGAAWWWIRPQRASVRTKQESRSLPQTAAADNTLTNDSIIRMAAKNVPASVIESEIRASKSRFDLSPDAVIQLTQAGVPPEVIETMRDPSAPPPAAKPVVLPDGLPVRLTLAENIPSDAAPGEAVRFRVAGDVRMNGNVAIAKGASAEGAIVDGSRHKLLLFPGKMTLRLRTVDAADGSTIHIRATASKGKDESKHPVNSAGHKPKNVASEAGTEYMGYVDGAQSVQIPGHR
jgi:serine/threonine-protein kinase